MSNDNKAGLALLDESGDVVEAKLDDKGLAAHGSGVVCGLLLGELAQTGLLLCAVLRLVLLEKLEELGGGGLVNCLGELVDGRGHLQALLEHLLLALQTHILGPLDKACEVALWLNVATFKSPNHTTTKKNK